MSEKRDKIIKALEKFGLEESEAEIYTYLIQNPKKSIYQISKANNLGRNIVYRLAQKLEEKNLIKFVQATSGYKLQALPYKNLEEIVAKKEAEASELKNVIPELFGNFAAFSSQNSDVKINYYQGIEGLKEITLNSLEAKKELLIFEVSDLSSFLDFGFAEKVRKNFVDRKIQVKEITNQKSMKEWTNVRKFVNNCWTCKYIDKQELKIEFEFLIYNNTYAMYAYKNNQIWGMEIISPLVASMQKQIFMYMWENAEAMDVLNDKGEACLGMNK